MTRDQTNTVIRCAFGIGSEKDFEKTAILFKAVGAAARGVGSLGAKAFTRPATWKVSKKTHPITFRASGGQMAKRYSKDPKTGKRILVKPAGRDPSLGRAMLIGAPAVVAGSAAAEGAKSNPRAYRRGLVRPSLSRGR